MRALHEDALICDFAQYYHVYDLDSLNVRTAAILACGLPKESRTLKTLRKEKVDQNTMLMASILDTCRNIEYGVFQSHSKKKIKKPKSVVQKLLGIDQDKKEEVKGFSSGDAFEVARQRLIQEMSK